MAFKKTGSVTTNGFHQYNDNVSIVGTDYTLSNDEFSTSSGTTYVNTGFNFADIDTSKPWELQIKLKTGTSVTTDQGVFSPLSAGNGCNIWCNQTINVALSSNNNSWDLNETTGTTDAIVPSPAVSTVYWCRVAYTGSSYVLSYSTDGLSWTINKTINKSGTIYKGNDYQLGTGRGVNRPFSGSIFLNGCYLKQNDTFFFYGPYCLSTDKKFGILKSSITTSDIYEV